MNWLFIFLLLIGGGAVVTVQIHLFLRLRQYARRLEREMTQQTKELLLSQILGIHHPLPSMRGWAISPDMGWIYVTQIFESRPQIIIECGSGVSTLLAAYSLKNLGSGKVMALEHDEMFAKQTMEQIRSHGLENFAQVLYSPLANHSINGISFLWYNLAPIPLSASIDLLFVDGPPGTLQKQSRYPALPLLKPFLHPRSQILMDDTLREDEQRVAKRWEQEFHLVSQKISAEKGASLLSFKPSLEPQSEHEKRPEL